MAHTRFIASIALACAAAIAAGSATSVAREPVYYTDFNSGPAVRPVYVDANRNVRSGPFRHWRHWGSSKAYAIARAGQYSTKVVMRQIRTCGGLRQYRVHSVYTYQSGRRIGHAQRFVNRACG